MNAGIRKRMAVAVAAASALAGLVVGVPSNTWAAPSGAQAVSQRAFGISPDGTLMATFTTDRPQVLDWVRTVTGLSGDTSLIGIDFRVQNGLLYGVGNRGGVYTIKTPPATADVVVTKVSQLSVTLSGSNYGVDFNPAADRLRIISDNGQNLVHNLANSTTTVNTTLTTDGATTHGVSAAAYTNNDLNATTGTTLLDINTTSDQVVIQSPPANGLLVANGSLGVNAAGNAGFDIYSDLVSGKTDSVTGFATLLSSSNTATFYTVNLFTGAANAVGQFPIPLADVAVALDTNP